MKALVVQPGPEFSVQDVYSGWVKGLRGLGVTVGEFNLADRLAFYSTARVHTGKEMVQPFNTEAACRMAINGLEAACYEFWPDVIVIVSGFFLQQPLLELLRMRGHKIILLHTESPYEDDRQIERAQFADLNVINDPTNIERFPDATVYLPHCYDPDVHYPRPPAAGYESEFCFVGTGYPSRLEFFEKVDWTGIDAQFAGNWQSVTDGSPLLPFLVGDRGDCCDNDETAVRYTSTLTSANLYRTEAQRPELVDGWACGPREIELAACGTWFARDARGESDHLFPMLPTFTTAAELGDLIRWALAHPEQRQEAINHAYTAIHDRTFEANAAVALRLLGF